MVACWNRSQKTNEYSRNGSSPLCELQPTQRIIAESHVEAQQLLLEENDGIDLSPHAQPASNSAMSWFSLAEKPQPPLPHLLGVIKIVVRRIVDGTHILRERFSIVDRV